MNKLVAWLAAGMITAALIGCTTMPQSVSMGASAPAQIQGPPYLLFTLYLKATDGAIDHYDVSDPMSVTDCVKKLEVISPVINGLAKMVLCRQVDQDGKAVPEFKVDDMGKPLDDENGSGPAPKPAEPETPKLDT